MNPHSKAARQLRATVVREPRIRPAKPKPVASATDINRVRVGLSVAGVILILWGGSVFYHSQRVVPTGVGTIVDFYERYGPPPLASTFEIETHTFYRVIGEISAPLALPSGPPHYIFNFAGQLVDWTPEFPRDAEFATNWPQGPGETPLAQGELLRRFPPRTPQ